MAKIQIEMSDTELKELVIKHLQEKLGNVGFKPADVQIEVITSKNYRGAEWEAGRFRARLDVLA